MKENKTIENVVIIGGGPAGLSAGIYLARAGLAPTIFAGSPPGGQLTLTSEVENYPGYESIMGPELVEKMRKQAIKFGAKIRDENVEKIEVSRKPFEVYLHHATDSVSDSFPAFAKATAGMPTSAALPLEAERRSGVGSPGITATYRVTTKSLIIATGAKALWLGVPGEERLRGKGVSACATCDGFFFKNKVVAVVGGGDTALEEALTLTKFAKHVVIIHRKGEFRASKIMQKRVLEHPNIEVIWNAAVAEVLGESRVEGLRLQINPKSEIRNPKQSQNSKEKNSNRLENSYLFRASNFELRILPLDGLFVAIGHKPDTDLFKGKVEMDSKGYVLTTARVGLENLKFEIFNLKSSSNDKMAKNLNIENLDLNKNLKFIISNYNADYQSATSVDGVFAVGDCVDAVYRQAATAVGMGVGGALDVEKYLEEVSRSI